MDLTLFTNNWPTVLSYISIQFLCLDGSTRIGGSILSLLIFSQRKFVSRCFEKRIKSNHETLSGKKDDGLMSEKGGEKQAKFAQEVRSLVTTSQAWSLTWSSSSSIVSLLH